VNGMIGDAKLQLNHRADPSTGPDLPPEAIGFGAPVQQVEQMRQLFGGQATGSAGMGAMPQGFWSPVPGALHPLADGPFADAQGLGDLALGPAFLLEEPGVQTACFFPVVGYRVHARQYIPGRPETLDFNVLVSK
jgi:hypothetical protein